MGYRQKLQKQRKYRRDLVLKEGEWEQRGNARALLEGLTAEKKSRRISCNEESHIHTNPASAKRRTFLGITKRCEILRPSPQVYN